MSFKKQAANGQPDKEVPNTKRPPADWQVPDPIEYPDPNNPGIRDPRPETQVPGETPGTYR